MKNTKFYIFAVLFIAAIFSLSCGNHNEPDNPQTPDEPQDTVELAPLTGSVLVTDNWIWDKRPAITFHVENPNAVAVNGKVKVKIQTDKKKYVTDIEKVIEFPAKSKQDVVISTDFDLEPGFYKAAGYIDGKVVRTFFGFGINPFDIVSAPDKQPDYDEFWTAAKKQLEGIEMKAELTEIPSRSNDKSKTYLVEMQSIPDGLTGDPVIIRGYYTEPQDGQKHPVILHFYGYDTQNTHAKPDCPTGDGKYTEFYLSHRGQYLNARAAADRVYDGKGDFENIYGDWFAYNFGNRDGYYYRGAFIDCVQAVRFMASRETSDMSNLFAEGSSQGGALCYAVASLSDYPFSAIAPNVAFLGDYPDYFEIVSWPAETARKNKGSMTDEEMYAFLSYFDTKNLATNISCAVWATSGLQDGTCPSHTNMAPFNNLLSTDKTMTFYPEMQHDYPKTWFSDIAKFFQAHTK